MGGEAQRLAGWVCDGPCRQGARLISSRIVSGRDGAVLDAEAALEQQRHRRVPDAFVVVVGRDAGDGAVLVADPGDDRGEHVGEFGADDQEPFGVGLGRCDLQQRDEFAGGWAGCSGSGCGGESSVSSSIRMPVWRSTSTAAQVQNARCSSR